MRTLSRIECNDVPVCSVKDCHNLANLQYDHAGMCTYCAERDVADALVDADVMNFNMRTYGTIDVPAVPTIAFPCKILFTIVPYVGMPRSLVHDCADQAQCDSYIDYYMSDTTGNTRKVMHTVYVAPQAK